MFALEKTQDFMEYFNVKGGEQTNFQMLNQPTKLLLRTWFKVVAGYWNHQNALRWWSLLYMSKGASQRKERRYIEGGRYKEEGNQLCSFEIPFLNTVAVTAAS